MTDLFSGCLRKLPNPTMTVTLILKQPGSGKKHLKIVEELYDILYRHPAYWTADKLQKGFEFFTGHEPVVDSKGNVRENLSDVENLR